ncbi:O-methyltransferase [Ammoniphilus resinae]|uniref:tRNA 5-hydroxyuridine methyltransferase n=1 Tax=Ammoniphilus resinae TaxID=861532 RepID=A0ABS4GJP3_9BACL|nr:O-methyltransferase [Ammoniphilus resinae]MBP1930471.1 caffeoyl-CoA O-methyltransferase [Ammoniphilus resinae]
MITEPKISNYIETLIPARGELLTQLEAEAKVERIPIIQLPSIQFMRTLFLAYEPKRVLEIGTAIGYSTIWLAEAAPMARITTMEIDKERTNRARNNFEKAGVRDRIELIEGDAGEGLPSHYRFDCLFLDAAKGQYRSHLDLYLPHLEPGGIVICDNVLFQGLVAEEVVENKRLAPMVKKIHDFNQYMMNHSELDSSLIPIGDGILFSVKKKK